MVLEQVLSSRMIKHKILFSIVLGFFYTLIAYFTTKIFFPESISIPMMFLISILLIPTIIKLISAEERIERKAGVRHFFSNHKRILEIYLFMFIGAVLGYFALGAMHFETYDNLFSYQMKFLDARGATNVNAEFTQQAASARFTGILTNNLTTALVFFILSFFYGAGGVFLLVLNASIFSAFAMFLINNFSKAASNLWATAGAFSVYLLPELFGFLVAAFSGGVISKALLTEKVGSDGFRNVVKDATLLLIFSFVMIILGAFLEVYVSAPILIKFIT